jgi:hypothetical protein
MAFARPHLRSGIGESVSSADFPEMKGDLIKRALCPFFGLRKPRRFMIRIQQGTLSTDQFLITNFGELIHSFRSHVKPIYPLKTTKH